MIKSKKIFLVLTSLAIAFSAFASDVTFSNKVYSDVVELGISEDGVSSDFAGIKNITAATLSTPKLDMGLKMNFWAYNGEDEVAGKEYPYFALGQKENLKSAGWAVTDYWTEVRPIDVLGIGFHRAYMVAGSYLPVEDDEISTGNIGSDLGVFIRPVENLTIGSGLDFVSVFGGYKDAHAYPLMNVGIEYLQKDSFGFGISFRNFINGSRSIGAYFSFMGVKGLVINAGFTYNGQFAGVSGDLLSAGVMFENDSFGINGDLVIDIDDGKNDGYDLYSGVEFTYNITKPLVLGAVGTLKADFNYDKSAYVGLHPVVGTNAYVKYLVNKHHVLSAGVNIEFADATTITLPVYWLYKL